MHTIQRHQSIFNLDPITAKSILVKVTEHLMQLGTNLPMTPSALYNSISKHCSHTVILPNNVVDEIYAQLQRDNLVVKKVVLIPLEQPTNMKTIGKNKSINYSRSKQIVEYNIGHTDASTKHTMILNMKNQINEMSRNFRINPQNLNTLAYMITVYDIHSNQVSLPSKPESVPNWIHQRCKFTVYLSTESVVKCLELENKIRIVDGCVVYNWMHQRIIEFDTFEAVLEQDTEMSDPKENPHKRGMNEISPSDNDTISQLLDVERCTKKIKYTDVSTL
jgi:hypothetical protein